MKQHSITLMRAEHALPAIIKTYAKDIVARGALLFVSGLIG